MCGLAGCNGNLWLCECGCCHTHDGHLGETLKSFSFTYVSLFAVVFVAYYGINDIKAFAAYISVDFPINAINGNTFGLFYIGAGQAT